MENDKYSIEYLRDTFLTHVEESRKIKEQHIEAFKRTYPDDPLPDSLKNDFSIPLALHTICDEIIKIKEKLDNVYKS